MRRWGLLGCKAACGGNRGQAFVELALVLPALVAIVFAVIELGTVAANQVALQHAASDGARAGATWGCLTDTSCEITSAQNRATASASDIKQCSPSPPNVAATVASAAAADGSTPQWITVTVTCTYAPITPLGGLMSLIGSTLNLNITRSASSKMRVAQ